MFFVSYELILKDTVEHGLYCFGGLRIKDDFMGNEEEIFAKRTSCNLKMTGGRRNSGGKLRQKFNPINT